MNQTEINRILSKAIQLAGKHPDIFNAIRRGCKEQSDGKAEGIIETYEYLNSLDDKSRLHRFLSWLSYLIKVSS